MVKYPFVYPINPPVLFPPDIALLFLLFSIFTVAFPPTHPSIPPVLFDPFVLVIPIFDTMFCIYVVPSALPISPPRSTAILLLTLPVVVKFFIVLFFIAPNKPNIGQLAVQFIYKLDSVLFWPSNIPWNDMSDDVPIGLHPLPLVSSVNC